MNMSDKELDQLFRSKLDNLEEEPSAGLWQELKDGVDHQTRRTKLNWFYRVAASVLLIGIGVWLILPERPAIQADVKIKKEMKLPEAVQAVEEKVPDIEKLETRSALVKAPVAKQTVLRHKHTRNQLAETTRPIVVKSATVTNDQAQDEITSHPEIPDLPLVSAVFPVESLSEPSFKAGQGMEATEIQMVAIERKQMKVKSLGDLINLVVAKVDMREDKIIEFDKHDEESNVTGINLGIIKFKREK